MRHLSRSKKGDAFAHGLFGSVSDAASAFEVVGELMKIRDLIAEERMTLGDAELGGDLPMAKKLAGLFELTRASEAGFDPEKYGLDDDAALRIAAEFGR